MNKFSISRFLRLCKLVKAFNQGNKKKYTLRLFNKPDLSYYKDYLFISLCINSNVNEIISMKKNKNLSLEQKTFLQILCPYAECSSEIHQYIQYLIRKRIDEKSSYQEFIEKLSEYTLEHLSKFTQEEYSIIFNNLFPTCYLNGTCFYHFNSDVNSYAALFDKNVINKLNEDNLKSLLKFLNENSDFVIERFLRCLIFNGYSKIHPEIYKILIKKAEQHINYNDIERLINNIPQSDIDKLFNNNLNNISSSESLLVHLDSIMHTFKFRNLSENMYKSIWETIEIFALEDMTRFQRIIKQAMLIFKNEPCYLNKIYALEVMAEIKEG